MRIAQVSTVCSPVRQEGSASIESMVWLLTRELVKLGHEVTVFGVAGSQTDGKFVETLPGSYGENGAPDDWRLCEMINLGRAIERSAEFDVMHSHAYLWGIPSQSQSRSPIVHTLHVTPYDDESRLRALYPDAIVTGLSKYQWSAYPALPPAAVIPHGVDETQFSFREKSDDYLCYLGRFTEGKGPLQAIRIAWELGMRLRLAGPRNDYFESQIRPLIDGSRIEYVGEVSGKGRDEFLGGARAMLYPISSPEPFGLVLVESMLCGTPIAAINLGAVGEIIEDGITGRCARDAAELTKIVPEVCGLDRKAVRRRATERFCARRMAEGYAAVYARAIAQRGAKWRR